MGVTLTDVLLFGKAQSDDIDNATLVIFRRNILRWSALGGYLDVIVKGVSPLSLPDAVANSLSYVKAFGGTEQRNLPDGYIQRQFIYMMDGSYLLTDIVPTYDCKIEMDFQTTSLPSGSVYLLGGRTETYGGIFFARSTGGAITVDAFGTSSDDRYTSSVSLSNNTRYKFTFNNKAATLESGGITLFTNTFTGENANGAALCINGLNYGSISGAQAGIYLYSFKVWNAQGVLVADYVPAVQKGTVPVVGFYDTVSKTFKTATAGTFAAGGESVPTPDTPMDIVCNNGVLKASINEFDANAITNGYFYNADLEWVANSSVYTTDYMKTVKGKYTLVLSKVATVTAALNIRVNLFNANNVIQSQTVIPITPDTTEYTYEIDIPDGISSVRISTNPTFVVVSGFSNSNSVYADGTVETINVHGKNLFDKDATLYLSGRFINDTTTVGGNIITTANGNYNVYRIPVRPSTTYTFGVIKASNPCWAVLDENDTVLQVGQHGAATVNSITVTTDATAKYLCLSVAVQGGYKCDDILQLEQGSTATTYEPYYNGGTATAEMLLSLGDYTDEQEIISGVVTRKLGVAVLDGTETWTKNSAGIFACQNLINNISNQDGYCTHFKKVADTTSFGDMTVGTYKFRSSGDKIVYFNYDTSATIPDWTQYLAAQYAAGTPVIIVYPLATQTTDTVTGQPMNTTAGDNILEITQASLDNLKLEAKYQAAVSLTIQEVQDANLDPNVEVTIN